jgi:hypothetical protein
MFYPLNRDLKKAFAELYFLKFFCVSYFIFYLFFLLIIKFSYVWSMAISFAIVVILILSYVFYCKRKLKTSLDLLWLSETEAKIGKVNEVLEEHGFSNNEKLSFLMDYYKDKINKSSFYSDILNFLVILLLLFVPMIMTFNSFDSYLITQIISSVGILFMIYLGYLIFKKIWNFSIMDLFNGQAFVRGIYEVLFYIYCRKMNEISLEKKNLKRVAYELKRN